MSSGGTAIRGSRVGAGPMGEQDRGYKAERITVNYYCSSGHEYAIQYAAAVEPAEIPELIDCHSCGLPAGQDKEVPPVVLKHEPYKTHLAYVKERRTLAEAKDLLEEAVASVRERRTRLAEEAKQAAKMASKKTTIKTTDSVAVKSIATPKPKEKISAAKGGSVKGAPAKKAAVKTALAKEPSSKTSKPSTAKSSKKK